MSSPKLDLSTTRIFKNTDEDIIEAMSLIGQEIYISDDEDFEYYQRCELVGVRKVEDSPFCYLGKPSDGTCALGYKYFILAEDTKFVEEVKKEEKKTLRPCASIVEFMNATDIKKFGDVIRIRSKELDRESYLTYSGYTLKEDCYFFVHLGSWVFSLQDLYENYECYDKDLDTWFSIGVEE